MRATTAVLNIAAVLLCLLGMGHKITLRTAALLLDILVVLRVICYENQVLVQVLAVHVTAGRLTRVPVVPMISAFGFKVNM